MTKEEFLHFVSKTIDEVLAFSQLHTEKSVPSEISFKWLKKDAPILTSKQEIIEEISNVVYLSKDKIYPCCDINIMEIKDGRLVLESWIANYEPRPFQNGWGGRPGPFIYAVNQNFISPNIDTQSPEFEEKLIKSGFRFKS